MPTTNDFGLGLRPCLYCNHPDPRLVIGRRAQVRCGDPDCEARGPFKDAALYAAIAWNNAAAPHAVFEQCDPSGEADLAAAPAPVADPCPHCGSDQVGPTPTPHQHGPWAVRCRPCHAQGPAQPSKALSVKAWDRRAGGDDRCPHCNSHEASLTVKATTGGRWSTVCGYCRAAGPTAGKPRHAWDAWRHRQ